MQQTHAAFQAVTDRPRHRRMIPQHFQRIRTLDAALVNPPVGIPARDLITMKDLMDYLDAKGEKEALANMQAYREKYGI